MSQKRSAIQERILIIRQKEIFDTKQAMKVVEENSKRTPYRRIDRLIIPESILGLGVLAILEQYGIDYTISVS